MNPAIAISMDLLLRRTLERLESKRAGGWQQQQSLKLTTLFKMPQITRTLSYLHPFAIKR